MVDRKWEGNGNNSLEEIPVSRWLAEQFVIMSYITNSVIQQQKCGIGLLHVFRHWNFSIGSEDAQAMR